MFPGKKDVTVWAGNCFCSWPFHAQKARSKSVFLVFALCHPMQRFVSKRSSSSVDLDSSSRDDVRTERAAIALSVGLSWPPRRRRRSAGRFSWQHLWERALQEHILNHHELPQGIRLQRPALWRPGETIDRPRTHEELVHISALLVPPLHSSMTSPAAALPSAARTTSTPSSATGSSTFWTSGRHGDGACSGAWVRSSVFAPGCSTGSTPTLLIAGNGAHHEQHRQENFAVTRRHDTAERAHHVTSCA